MQRRKPAQLGAVSVGLDQQSLRLTLNVPHPDLLVVANGYEFIRARPGEARNNLGVLFVRCIRMV